MPKVTLTGLLPGNGEDPRKNKDSALIAVYRSRYYNTPNAELLFEASPDKNGSIIKEIPDELIGEKITIVLLDLKFHFQNIEKVVEELGVFHVYNLQKDFNYKGKGVEPKELNEIDTHKMHIKGQEDVFPLVRASKYNNRYVRNISWLITFGAPFLGLVLAGVPGVIIGLILSFIMYFMTPYITGDKKLK